MKDDIDEFVVRLVDELEKRGNVCSIGIDRDDHTRDHQWVKKKIKGEEVIANNKWKVYTALLITFVTWAASILLPLVTHFSER